MINYVTHTHTLLDKPGVDSVGGEQVAAQAAVCKALALAFCVTLWEGLDDLHEGLRENTSLIVHRALKSRREDR